MFQKWVIVSNVCLFKRWLKGENNCHKRKLINTNPSIQQIPLYAFASKQIDASWSPDYNGLRIYYLRLAQIPHLHTLTAHIPPHGTHSYSHTNNNSLQFGWLTHVHSFNTPFALASNEDNNKEENAVLFVVPVQYGVHQNPHWHRQILMPIGFEMFKHMYKSARLQRSM